MIAFVPPAATSYTTKCVGVMCLYPTGSFGPVVVVCSPKLGFNDSPRADQGGLAARLTREASRGGCLSGGDDDQRDDNERHGGSFLTRHGGFARARRIPRATAGAVLDVLAGAARRDEFAASEPEPRWPTAHTNELAPLKKSEGLGWMTKRTETARRLRGTPRGKATLTASSRVIFRRLTEEYGIADAGGLEILRSGLRALDQAEAAEERIAKDGQATVDWFGQVRAHPLLAVARDFRGQWVATLRALNLAVGEPPKIGRPEGS